MPTNNAAAAPSTAEKVAQPAPESKPGRGVLATVLLVLWFVWIAALAWVGLGEWGHSRLPEAGQPNRGRPAPALHSHPEAPAE